MPAKLHSHAPATFVSLAGMLALAVAGLLVALSGAELRPYQVANPRLLSAVLSSHPPKRVPLGAIIGAVIAEPASFQIPTPHGLETRTSEAPSPS